MSTKRWAGLCFAFLGACFLHGLGCGSSSTGAPPADAGTDVKTTSTTSAGTAGAGGGSSTTTSSTTTGGTGGSGGSVGGTNLGAKCTADADCGAGFTCIKSSDNLSGDPASPGGIGNGLCTIDCTTDPMACGPTGGVCVAIDIGADGASVSKAACFESCAIGPNPPAAPVAKCHGRQDVACEPVNQAETLFACIPICVTDADCGGTRKCEASSGLCVDTPMAGKTVGSGCTVTRGMSNNECAGGLCLPIEAIPDGGTTTPGVCTALCRLGTQEACGYRITGIDAGPPMGACVLPWGDTGYNTGDLGLCLQLCDGANDCSYKAANWTCRTDITLRGFGHSVCLVPPAG
jgi:hypothetical protein